MWRALRGPRGAPQSSFTATSFTQSPPSTPAATAANQPHTATTTATADSNAQRRRGSTGFLRGLLAGSGGGAATRRERDLAEARARAEAAARGPVHPAPTDRPNPAAAAAALPQHRPGYKVCPAVNVTTSRPVFYPSPSGRYCAVFWPESSAYVVLDVQIVHVDASDAAAAGRTPSRRDRAAVRPAGAAASPRRTPQRLCGTPVRAAAAPSRDAAGTGATRARGKSGFFSAGRASLRSVAKAALRDSLGALTVGLT